MQHARALWVALFILGLVTGCGAQLPDSQNPDTVNASQPGAPCTGSALSAEVLEHDWSQVDLGRPVLLSGTLGCLATRDATGESEHFATTLIDRLGSSGRETFVARKTLVDDLGQVHVRLIQQIDGAPVEGAELVVHSLVSTGEVIAVNGRIVLAGELPDTAEIGGSAAIDLALAEAGIDGNLVDAPQLTWVLGPDGAGHLAWATEVAWTSEEGPELDRVFADARTGALITRHPHYQRALNRQVFDSANGTGQGTLIISEGGMSGDQVAQDAYDFMGDAYNYLQTKFGRDSYDDAGTTLTSRVHYDVNLNNAFWNGTQLTFGDGDGNTFTPLSQSRDVVAHELGHGVIQETAALIYQDESGALNESYADVLGVSTDSFARGSVDANTWLLGEEVFTPGTANDGLRYMDDPTVDGISSDFYPERYQGNQDNGGVHLNSGISNLAYYLVVEGGAHPRGKTAGSVPAIGMEKAEQIWFRALEMYLGQSATFAEARAATGWAARDLYGYDEYYSVHSAWTTVGVAGNFALFSATINGKTDATAYAPANVQFNDESGGATSWSWSFGDNTSSVEQNPTRTYDQPGTYEVTLTINGDPNTQTPPMPITLVEKPAVDFDANQLTGVAPLTVSFQNLTTGNVSGYTWHFGDDATSSEENPTYEFAEPGEYTVRLVALGEAGPVEQSKEAYIVVTEGDGSLLGGCNCALAPSKRSAPSGAWLLALLAAGAAVLTRRRRH